MKARFTSLTEHAWSSFAYEIEATSLLTDVLHLLEGDDRFPFTLAGVQTRLSTFLTALPPERTTCANPAGGSDEVMFRALITIHITIIHLYLVLSGQSGPSPFTQCHTQRHAPNQSEGRLYWIAAVRSANSISKLLTARAGFSSISPCISCAAALSATVQLRASVGTGDRLQASMLQDYVNLHHVVLTTLSARWPIARAIRLQLISSTDHFLQTQIEASGSTYTGEHALATLDMLNLDNMGNDDLWFDRILGGPDATELIGDITPSLRAITGPDDTGMDDQHQGPDLGL